MEEDLPFESYPGWDDPLTYSHLCRGWYKSVAETPYQNSITEAYLFFNAPLIGVSACAPIFRESHEEKKMYGTSCQDITLTNDLIEYFDLDIVDIQDSFITIMNKDPILDTENIF